MSQIFRCVYLLLANSGYSPRRGVDRGGAQTNEVYMTYLIAIRICSQGACCTVTRQCDISNELRSWPDAGFTVKRQPSCDLTIRKSRAELPVMFKPSR